MKKYFVCLLVLFLMPVINLTAQDDQLDSLDFQAQNYNQYEDEPTGYLAIGGGPILNLLPLNYDDINNMVKKNNFNLGKDFTLNGMMAQWGAQGFATIVIIPNVRLGVIGASGSMSPGSIITDTLGHTRNFSFAASFTGITIDYAYVPFKHFKFAMVPSLIIGRGSMTVTTNQTSNNLNFNNLPNITDSSNFMQTIQTSYWYFSPMLNFEYAPTLLSLFRASVGYSFTTTPSWYLNGNTSAAVNNVPSGIKANGLTLQFGIIFGLFNY